MYAGLSDAVSGWLVTYPALPWVGTPPIIHFRGVYHYQTNIGCIRRYTNTQNHQSRCTHICWTQKGMKNERFLQAFGENRFLKTGFLIIWQFNIDIINATIFRHERGYDCLLLALPFIFSYHSIWNNSCCSVWGRHWCGLVGMYLEVFSGYLEFWGRRLSSLSIRQACVAPHS